MATRSVLIDDMDGKTKAALTVPFTFDGQAFEIDLSSKHHSELLAALEPFMKAARKVARNGKTETVSDAAEVRAWAAENDVEVPARGRIPSAVREAYEARESA